MSHKYVDEGDLQDNVMVPAKDVKIITYEVSFGENTSKTQFMFFSFQLLESQYIQKQELSKTVTGNVPNKSVTLYYIDLAWVTRVQVMILTLYIMRADGNSDLCR